MAVSDLWVTVKATRFELMPPSDAEILLLPCANVEAMPLLLMVAMVVLLDDQVTVPEIFPVVPSA